MSTGWFHPSAGTKPDESYRIFADRSLPGFVLSQIRSRLRYACGVVLAFALFIGIAYITDSYRRVFVNPTALQDATLLLGALWSSGMALLVIFLLRRDRSPIQLISIAILFQAVISFLGATVDAFFPYPENYVPGPRAFWTCIWIVLYPLLVPLSPRLSLLSSSLSVTVIYFTFHLPPKIIPEQHVPPIVIEMVVETHLLMVLIAYAAARGVHFLNWQIAHERKKGSYELVSLLGNGAMGQVWLARHRMLRRPAALKIIDPIKLDAASEEDRKRVIQRFEREAQATSSLYNQHSISLYDFGVMEDGSFFYVMEALDGYDLDEFVSRWGMLSPARTVYLMLQICDSLIEAHRIGLIHRDLKPANVFVCRYGFETDFIKVLDFGMVKVEHNIGPQLSGDKIPMLGAHESAALTSEGQISGTPAFMAPEMIERKKVDSRYDIYALGCVGYWMLTSSWVFPFPTVSAQVLAHLEKTPEPVSKRRGEPVPEDLEKLIMKCLEKGPNSRPQTVVEIRQALREIQLQLAETWTQDDAQQWWREHAKEDGDRPSRAAGDSQELFRPPASGTRYHYASEEATIESTHDGM